MTPTQLGTGSDSLHHPLVLGDRKLESIPDYTSVADQSGFSFNFPPIYIFVPFLLAMDTLTEAVNVAALHNTKSC